MNRRILYIILGAIALILLVVLLWVWLLGRPTPTPNTSGTFGTASSTQNGTLGSGGGVGNIPGTVNQNQGSGGSAGGNLNTGGNMGIGGNINPGDNMGVGGNLNTSDNIGMDGNINPGDNMGVADMPGPIEPGGPIAPSEPIATGAEWLFPDGTGGDTSGGVGVGLGSDFNPRIVNQLNNGSVDGSPTILGNTVGGQAGAGSGIGLEGALIGVAAGTALCTAGLLGGVSGAGVGAGSTVVGAAASVPVNDISLNLQTAYGNTLKSSDTFKTNFLDCITRTIAKAALQQVTASVVNWINSGFNGSPSFITNYQQFFQNVADVAAGEYIRGSGLSFLCSPFQLQIRIAVAKSYANRNNAVGSCTLSKVVGNINSFMSGNFSQGGWPGLLQFTTMPTNNPYGAYAYAQIGLQTAQSNAYQNANRNMTATGFLNFQQEKNCTVTSGPPSSGTKAGQKTTQMADGLYRTCSMVTATPGSVIESSLAKTLSVSQDSLTQAGISGSFDAIINALITQLMTRTLYGGLSNLSGSGGYQTNFLTPAEQQAQEQARTLMTAMQADVTVAQQYGEAQQGSIADIQNTQQHVASLRACWEGWATGTGISTTKQSQALVRAEAASTTLEQLDAQVDVYNGNILRANNAIASIQNLQTQALNVASAADVAAVAARYEEARASGQLTTSADVTTAQQNRITLQAQLSTLTNATSAELQQCYAFTN